MLVSPLTNKDLIYYSPGTISPFTSKKLYKCNRLLRNPVALGNGGNRKPYATMDTSGQRSYNSKEKRSYPTELVVGI